MKLIIPILTSFLVLFSCSTKIVDNETKEIIEEEIILDSKPFITSYTELNDTCRIFLSEILSDFYTNENETISKFYQIEAELFPEHYTFEENEKITKFVCFVKRDTTLDYYFFGINNELSDYLWLNELLKETNTPILTKEEHYILNTDFSLLEKHGYLKLKKDIEIMETQYSLETFETNNDNLWVIDSVLFNKEKSIFKVNEKFCVKDNKVLIFNDKEISFYYDNWKIFFIDDLDTVSSRIVSWSDDARIIYEEIEKTPLVFMHKIK